MAKVLIIDDDKGVCHTLSRMVKRAGHEATSAHTLKDGYKAASTGSFDIVFLDVRMPDGLGLDHLSKIRETSSKPEVIIITAIGDADGAELAIRNGAWDYIQKPSSIKEMNLSLLRVIQYREEKKSRKKSIALKREGIIGSSSKIKTCLNRLAQAADVEANVLITGETGTGKELFAWAIHENSDRARKNFVVVDCTTLPETLVESLLFGFKKGAFTGADQSQEGLIQQAHGGTLFLDEVGDLAPSIQKGFLRALQERRFRPLGSKKEEESDFRLLAATNRDLDAMVKQGRFREDLYYRLRSFIIDLPPLRARIEDIKDLAMYHVSRLCEHYDTGTKGFSSDFFPTLESYNWPGNVRELFNALESALTAVGNGPTLYPIHLPMHMRTRLIRASIRGPDLTNSEHYSTSDSLEDFPRLRDFRRTTEKKYLQDLLAYTDNNLKKACSLSGLSKSRFYALLKKHTISKHFESKSPVLEHQDEETSPMAPSI